MREDERKPRRTLGQMERSRGEKMEGDRWRRKKRGGEHGDGQGGLNLSLFILLRQ